MAPDMSRRVRREFRRRHPEAPQEPAQRRERVLGQLDAPAGGGDRGPGAVPAQREPRVHPEDVVPRAVEPPTAQQGDGAGQVGEAALLFVLLIFEV